MRRDIYLYIGGLKADLSDRSFILLNYAMNDLADPAKVSNSYSQQVTLPGTPANDAIFGDFFRPDRYISGTGTGIGYDPRKKVDFAIYAETGEIIESGYVVLNSIRSSRSGGVEYRVTLFGGLGSFFQSLSYISGTGKRRLGADVHDHQERHRAGVGGGPHRRHRGRHLEGHQLRPGLQRRPGRRLRRGARRGRPDEHRAFG